MSTDAFEGWAIVDLMGHTRLAGKVTEVEMFGAKMGRIDVPEVEGKPGYTQFFGGGSVFRMTPTTEEIAVALTKRQGTPPVQRFELQLPPAPKIADAQLADDDDRGVAGPDFDDGPGF